jgi:hypothetical protein
MITVIVEPDDFSVIVEEDAEYANYYQTDVLVDENGEILVDENGEILVVSRTEVGAVFVVQVPTDDFSVIVEEDTP